MGRRLSFATLALIAVLGFAAWRWLAEEPAAARATPERRVAIPVEAAAVTRADVPVYLRGLGTVQAFNTVTVRPRVDGEIQKIAFREGQNVRPGDLLAQIDPRPFQAQLDQALAVKAQDDAKLANARLDLQRYLSLASREFASRQSVDAQRALVAQLDATVKADEATIENARVQLGYTTITSPIDGRTGLRRVDQGNIVHAGDAGGLVVITQLQPISVIFTLPEETLPELTQEMAAHPLSVTALSRDGKDTLDEGQVTLVDNQIDPATGTIRLKATFPNNGNALWPGQFVNVRVLTRSTRDALIVPPLALQRGPQGMYAYVIRADMTAEIRPLKVGQIDGGIAVIEDGLQEGDRVVTAGHYRLQPGARVDIRVAAASASAAAVSR